MDVNSWNSSFDLLSFRFFPYILWDHALEFVILVEIWAGQLSEPFQKLLEQLVDQHLAELAERDPKPPPEPPQAGEVSLVRNSSKAP